MSDAWCDDCGDQMVELFPVWRNGRQRWVCWECAFGYQDDEPPDARETAAESGG